MKISELQSLVEQGKDYKELIEIKSYIPFITKKLICESIVNGCISESEENGLLFCDYYMKRLLTDISFVVNFTNLEIEEDKYVENYDYVSEFGILDYILNKINDSDCFFINYMVDEEIETKLKICNSLEGIVAKGIEKFISIVDKNMNSKEISKIIKLAGKELKNFDPNKYKEIQSMLNVVNGGKGVEK
jgi:hypothetical protein